MESSIVFFNDTVVFAPSLFAGVRGVVPGDSVRLSAVNLRREITVTYELAVLSWCFVREEDDDGDGFQGGSISACFVRRFWWETVR